LSAAVATAATVAASIAACPALLLPLLLSLSLLIALALLPTRRAPYPLLLHVKRRRCFKGFGVQIRNDQFFIREELCIHGMAKSIQ
jgi:hypothetical protein